MNGWNNMLNEVMPEKAGLETRYLEAFMARIENERLNLHSVLMLRGNDLFFEKYWAPYSPHMPQRMYSITKNFVCAAIGCLIDEGKIRLDDCIVQYFPDKLPPEVDPLLKQQTILDMLTMRSCFLEKDWMEPGVTDRLKYYFAQKVEKVPGTIFDYDSNGTYVLGVLVERLSGMPLLDYLREKILNRIGGFENAEMLMVPDGTPWADSGLLCTPRALLNFARFVMNLGTWDGEQLLSRSFLEAATRKQTVTDLCDAQSFRSYGYGYQTWMGEEKSFFFYGMGGQFAICLPEHDLIFVCTADVQLSSFIDKNAIHRAFFDCVVSHLDGKEPPVRHFDLNNPLALRVARGGSTSSFQSCINGITYCFRKNAMGISEFSLCFSEDGNGTLRYVNAQGKKELSFGLQRNVFSKFPQFGYSDFYGNVVTTNGHCYDCACSAGWISEQMLQIRVQIIDRYLGVLIITVGFKDENQASIYMAKRAENFLEEYQGFLIGQRK